MWMEIELRKIPQKTTTQVSTPFTQKFMNSSILRALITLIELLANEISYYNKFLLRIYSCI